MSYTTKQVQRSLQVIRGLHFLIVGYLLIAMVLFIAVPTLRTSIPFLAVSLGLLIVIVLHQIYLQGACVLSVADCALQRWQPQQTNPPRCIGYLEGIVGNKLTPSRTVTHLTVLVFFVLFTVALIIAIQQRRRM